MTFPSLQQSLQALREARDLAIKSCKPQAATRWVAFECAAPTGAAADLIDLKLSRHSVYWGSQDELAEPKKSSTVGLSDHSVGDKASSRPSMRSAIEFVGLGASESFRFEGDSRFAKAKTAIEDCYKKIYSPEGLRSHLRFFGGASFSPYRDGKGPCWSDFGDAFFFLPRVFYVDEGRGARLICLIDLKETCETLSLAEKALEIAFSEARLKAPPDSSLHAVQRKDSAPPEEWKALISSIQAGIATGSLEKVVAARRVTMLLSDQPQISHVLKRLNQVAPRCARFALRIGTRTFVGATPERLVKKHGRQVQTEALAGSIDALLPNGADLLLASKKDRAEHKYVTQMIERSLRPLCSQLNVPPEPEVRKLKHIYHLRTPIDGALRAGAHILTLVDRLHPTPAVGGFPQEDALAWIREHEQAERGWYAAPIGWISPDGDGEFVVALRSALICEDKVHVYAGAGIVAASDAQAEYAETELKLSGMLLALGLRNRGSCSVPPPPPTSPS